MQSSFRRLPVLGVVILAGLLILSGCATKKYVNLTVDSAVAKVDPKIAAVDTKVREAGERIDAVDRRATQGIQAADQKATAAGTAAATADTKAVNAQRSADTAAQGVTAANGRITAVEGRFNSIDNWTSGPASTIVFKNNSADISDDAKKTLDGIAGQIGNLQVGYAIEVQGFTDDRGSESFNFSLAERRAQSVRRYLVGKNIPPHRISVVGVGEGNPVADNKTKDGRDKNRRVEVRVLRSAMGRTGGN